MGMYNIHAIELLTEIILNFENSVIFSRFTESN